MKNKMTDIQQQTINLIQKMFADDGLSYPEITLDKIRQARIDVGMTPGSQGDLVKLKHLWADINGIDKHSNQLVGGSKEKLIGRVLESLEAEFKQVYEARANIAIAKAKELQEAAEYEAAQLKTELAKRNEVSAEQLSDIEKLTGNINELRLERDNVLDEKRLLDKENSNLRLKLAGVEKQNQQLEKQLQQQHQAYDALRQDMEAQRQSQLKLIDDAKQETKQMVKQHRDVQTQLDKLHTKLNDAERQVAVANEKQKLVVGELNDKTTTLKQLEKNYQGEVTRLEKDNASLQKLVAKLEGQLEVAENGQAEFNAKLMAQLKTLQTKSAKKAKA